MARTQVQSELIATNAISGTIIADNAITATHIATNAISGTLVQSSGITTDMIASNNVTAAKIVSDGIETRHLHSNVISGQSSVTAASGDYVLIGDTSDSNNLKKALVSDFGVAGISSSADATAITIDSSENVGINNTSPSAQLQVSYAASSLTDATGLLVSNTSASQGNRHSISLQSPAGAGIDVGIGFYAGTTAAWSLMYDNAEAGLHIYDEVNTDKVLTVRAGGNVGIGENDPDVDLHVRRTTTSASYNYAARYVAAFERNGACDVAIRGNSSSSSNLSFSDEADADVGRISYDHGSNYMAFTTNTTERMRIDSSGNVGIGVTSMTETLVVSGDTDVTGQMYLGPNSNDRRPFAKPSNWGYSSGYKAIVLGSTSATYNTSISGAVTLSFNYDPSGNSNGSFSGNGNEILFRNGTQFVTPNSADDAFNLKNLVLKDGKVLIGDTASHTDDLFQIETPASGGGHGIQIRRNDSNGDQGIGRIMFGNNNDTDLATIASITDGQADCARLVFSTQPTSGSSTERMRIDSDGKVGINTTTMNATLNAYAGSTNAQSASFTGLGGNVIKFVPYASTGGFSSLTHTNDVCILAESAGGIVIAHHASGDNGIRIADNGDLEVGGALSKASGSFKISHPLDSKKDTHHLVHSFIEGPQADLIYRGKVNLVGGSATVNIDTVAGMSEGTFVALNTDVQVFTSNETDWDNVKGSVVGNILTITCQNNSSTATVSWLVIGERQDQHMIDANWTDENGKVIVESLKETE